MDPISKPVSRTDFDDKVEGRARLCADMRPEGLLYARTLRADRPHAELLSVEIPPLPAGVFAVDRTDLPGVNRIPLVVDDQPFFAEERVRYVGEPILLLAGPDRDELNILLSQCKVLYRELPAIPSLEEREMAPLNPADAGLLPDFPFGLGGGQTECHVTYVFTKGDMGMALGKGLRCVTDVCRTGWQEQGYLEPQSMLGEVAGDKVTVSGSMQCPYYVKSALERALGWSGDRVRVRQLPTGGGFGGKEEFPSLIGTHAGLAAVKAGHPVQLVYDRAEDIACTTKRHPSLILLRSWLDDTGRILATDIDITLDGGAYAGLSSVVLQRSMFTATGAYAIPNLRVRGRAMQTNSPPTGAFRGFGGPQAIFAIETHMAHIARELGADDVVFRRRHFLHKGDTSATGGVFHQPIVLDRMLAELEAIRPDPEPAPAGKLHGRGLSFFPHGCGFTGSGEQDLLKSHVRLRKEPNGEVRILVSSTEIGQGASTVLRKIVARTLEVPLDVVAYVWPDTDLCPDSGPTVASRTTMIVGRMLQECALELKSRMDEPEVDIVRGYTELLRPGASQEHDGNAALYLYPLYPDNRWNNETFQGNAYPEYAWGANEVETEVDPDTGEITVLAVRCVFDIGVPMDERIVRGQIEGGMLQGLGYGGIERLSMRDGRFLQHGFTDYMIPTVADAPAFACRLVDNPNAHGPFGARGLGELSLAGAAAALALSVSDAVGKPVDRLPVTPESVMWSLPHHQSRRLAHPQHVSEVEALEEMGEAYRDG